MNLIAVPSVSSLPSGLRYMIAPGHHQVNHTGRMLLDRLVSCSIKHDCSKCRYLNLCRFIYDCMVEYEFIKNWQGVSKNVTRYYQ